MNCDRINRRRDGVIEGDYSCHVCLIKHYGTHPDDPVTYAVWEDDIRHQVENTLEVYLIDRGLLDHV